MRLGCIDKRISNGTFFIFCLQVLPTSSQLVTTQIVSDYVFKEGTGSPKVSIDLNCLPLGHIKEG